MVPGVKPDGAVRSLRPTGGAPVKRGWPHGPVRSGSAERTRPWPPPPFAAHARRGFAFNGAERDQAAAAAAGGNAGGDLVGDGAERFSGPVAGRRSGGGAGGSGWRRGLAPIAAAPPSPKRRAVSHGPVDSEEEAVLLPAVLEKVAAAKGGASAAYRYRHAPEASVRSAGFLEINGAGGFFGARSDQLGEKHLETLAAQGEDLEEGEIADTVDTMQGMIKNDAFRRKIERQELEEGKIAATMHTVEDMNKNVLDGPAEGNRLEEGATMDIVGVMAKEDLDGSAEGHGLEEGEIATTMDIGVEINKDALYGSVDGQDELEEGEIAFPMFVGPVDDRKLVDEIAAKRHGREQDDGEIATKTGHTKQQSHLSVDVIPHDSPGGIIRRKVQFTVGKSGSFSSTSASTNTMKKFKAASIDLASTSAMASKEKRKFESVFVTREKLKGKTAIYLKDDDILMAVAVHEGKLELCLGATSRGRVLHHSPHGGGPNADRRTRVRMMCRRFQFLCRFLAQAVKEGSVELSRVDLAAGSVIKKLPDYIKYQSIEGEVDGVEVGDEFMYRVELAIVGLHNPFRAGIDTTKDTDGEPIAVSIVASGGYLDEYCSSGELIYIGSGGKAAGTDQDGDQKLERGNLALQNCIERKIPVRVTHGFKTLNREEDSHSIGKEMPKFIYDGLYHVVGFWEEGIPGSRVFKYRLRRKRGQPKLPLHVAKWLRESVVRPR